MDITKALSSSNEGEWHTYRKDQKTGEELRYQIRVILPEKHREIEKRNGLNKRQTRFDARKQENILDRDFEQEGKCRLEKACFALNNSDGADLPIGDEATATEFTKLLGRPVKAGERVRLDGHWSDEVKARVLPILLADDKDKTDDAGNVTEKSFATWFSEHTVADTLKAQVEEAGKEPTS